MAVLPVEAEAEAAASRVAATADIPLVLVDDHNDCVPFLYAIIRRNRRSPVKPLVVLHVDAHPDFSLPATGTHVDDYGPRQSLSSFYYDTLSSSACISEWLLPLHTKGLVRETFWVRSPWSKQFEGLDGAHTFQVGHVVDVNDGGGGGAAVSKVSWRCPYFTDDGQAKQEHEAFAPQSIVDVRFAICTAETLCQHHASTFSSSSSSSSSSYVLDICLDYFSTRNPFLHEGDASTSSLPHHESTDEEIELLVEQLFAALSSFDPPVAIVIARSQGDGDEYISSSQVDATQAKVLAAIAALWKIKVTAFDFSSPPEGQDAFTLAEGMFLHAKARALVAFEEEKTKEEETKAAEPTSKRQKKEAASL